MMPQRGRRSRLSLCFAYRSQLCSHCAACILSSCPIPFLHLIYLFYSLPLISPPHPHITTSSLSIPNSLTIFYICGTVQQIPTRSRDSTCPYYCLYCPCFRLEIVRARFHPKVIEGERGEWSGAEARRKKKRGKVIGRSNIIYFLILTLSFFFFFFWHKGV